ncbi:MAG: Holliday junction resolvase RuvX, partial [Bacillota bacterium]
LPVELWDERLTTVAAERVLDEAGLTWRKKRRVVDMTAACLILQSYLDSRRPGDQG